MNKVTQFKKYLVTWTEIREVEVFAKSEDVAIDDATYMAGKAMQKRGYKVKEADT